MSVNIYDKVTGELIQIAGNANGVIDDANISNKTTYSSDKIVKKIEKISATVDLSGYAKTVDVNESLSNKVDKIDGKGLSTNDFTDEYKVKVDEIENITNCYYIENLGIKCDGTDEFF